MRFNTLLCYIIAPHATVFFSPFISWLHPTICPDSSPELVRVLLRNHVTLLFNCHDRELRGTFSGGGHKVIASWLQSVITLAGFSSPGDSASLLTSPEVLTSIGMTASQSAPNGSKSSCRKVWCPDSWSANVNNNVPTPKHDKLSET